MALATHILVGTDFSDRSKHAVQTGAELAKLTGAELTLLHVFDGSIPRPNALGTGIVGQEGVDDELTAQLASWCADELGDGHGAKVDVIDDPSAATAICDYAAAKGVDLIVLATQGKSGLERLLIGSVAEKVVRHARCAVLTVRD